MGRSCLSVDVGLKNLALCRLSFRGESGEAEVLQWELLDLSGSRGYSAVTAGAEVGRRLAESRLGLPEGERWSQLLLENQPAMKNPKMKAMQTAIHAVVADRCPDASVTYVSASCKNSLSDAILGLRKTRGSGMTPSQRYREAKKRSVAAAEELIGGVGCSFDAAAAASFRSSPKKDDLSDALLQGLWWGGFSCPPDPTPSSGGPAP